MLIYGVVLEETKHIFYHLKYTFSFFCLIKNNFVITLFVTFFRFLVHVTIIFEGIMPLQLKVCSCAVHTLQ